MVVTKAAGLADLSADKKEPTMAEHLAANLAAMTAARTEPSLAALKVAMMGEKMVAVTAWTKVAQWAASTAEAKVDC